MNPLRKPNINYFKGWFFVTMRGARNQSVLGVIDDNRQTTSGVEFCFWTLARRNTENGIIRIAQRVCDPLGDGESRIDL